MKVRPCFLVLDAEHGGSISTRKLVLETAKYNVITAYSCKEGIAELERFPRVHAVILNSALPDPDTESLFAALDTLPEVKIIVVGDGMSFPGRREPDLVVPGFAPAKLLAALPELFPREAAFLGEREEALERADL